MFGFGYLFKLKLIIQREIAILLNSRIYNIENENSIGINIHEIQN